MSPYASEGSLTSESREVAVSETWDTWANPQASSNVVVVDGSIQLAERTVPLSESDSKLIHRWYLSEDNDPFVDQVGSADGTNNGATQTTGDWVNDAARSGDGTDDYIETTEWGSFGSDMSNDFAIAFSFETSTTDGGGFIAVGNSGDATNLVCSIGPTSLGGDQAAEGELYLFLRDGSNIAVTTDSTFNDGNPHRVVFNKTANSASGLEIWVDQTEVSVTEEYDDAFGSPTDFDVAVPFFARNNEGTPDEFVDAVMDDPCVYNDSLTQSEIESYENPWS